MKHLLIALTLALPAIAQADIIKCSFTEPFINVEYSMTQSTLRTVDMEGKKTVTKNVSFQILGAGSFELRNKYNNVIMRLELNNKGSDGMSDRIYPYESQWLTKGLWGGCTSNFLHASN